MDMSNALLDEGVYIKGLWYPVVPKGEARLRAQISAAFDKRSLDRALDAFETGRANAMRMYPRIRPRSIRYPRMAFPEA